MSAHTRPGECVQPWFVDVHNGTYNTRTLRRYAYTQQCINGVLPGKLFVFSFCGVRRRTAACVRTYQRTPYYHLPYDVSTRAFMRFRCTFRLATARSHVRFRFSIWWMCVVVLTSRTRGMKEEGRGVTGRGVHAGSQPARTVVAQPPTYRRVRRRRRERMKTIHGAPAVATYYSSHVRRDARGDGARAPDDPRRFHIIGKKIPPCGFFAFVVLVFSPPPASACFPYFLI